MKKKKSKSEFVEVKCEECGNEQTVFNKPSRDVLCLVCDKVLVESTGGKGDFKIETID